MSRRDGVHHRQKETHWFCLPRICNTLSSAVRSAFVWTFWNSSLATGFFLWHVMSPCMRIGGTANPWPSNGFCDRSLTYVQCTAYNYPSMKALTRLRLPSAIHEGPSFVVSGLTGEWEGDRRSAGSCDFPEGRSGLCEAGPFFRSHFLNIEWPRGDSTVSRFFSGRVSEVGGTGWESDCDTA